MEHGRKVKDEELEEVAGGIDELTDVDSEQVVSPTGSKGSGPKFPPPGGSPGLDDPPVSGGDHDLGPGD